MPDSDPPRISMRPGELYELPKAVECLSLAVPEGRTDPCLFLMVEGDSECMIPVTEQCLVRIFYAIARRYLPPLKLASGRGGE